MPAKKKKKPFRKVVAVNNQIEAVLTKSIASKLGLNLDLSFKIKSKPFDLLGGGHNNLNESQSFYDDSTSAYNSVANIGDTLNQSMMMNVRGREDESFCEQSTTANHQRIDSSMMAQMDTSMMNTSILFDNQN